MTAPDPRPASRTAPRIRREPPKFRQVVVHRTERVNPRLIRVTLTGPELEGFAVDEPAASVRLLLPPAGSRELVMPTWNGNEFLLPGDQRPPIRTLTPLRADPAAPTLDVEIVDHGTGAASQWASAAQPGDPAAISGPGRGYAIDDEAPAYLLAGDETALPAMGQLLEALPPTTTVDVHVEIGHPDARIPLAAHPDATVTWHELPGGAPPGEAMVAAVRQATVPDGARVWVAGEAAAVQRIRRHLFDDRGLPRSQTTVRGYWKHGRSGDNESS